MRSGWRFGPTKASKERVNWTIGSPRGNAVSREPSYAAPVLFVSLRDLQWRLRRFMIGVLATRLVFAIALLISGIDASFQNEAKRAVAAFRADQWVVSQQAFGPFTSSNLVQDSDAAKIAKMP